MKSVVITGSTRGIGYGMAEAFLAKSCRVFINGRSQETVDRACKTLSDQFGSDLVSGLAAEVSEAEEVEHLWEAAKEALGEVDIWINNAGVGHDTLPFWELPAAEARKVIAVDVLGTIYGSQMAMRGMIEQGQGQIYNMEGFGSSGNIRSGMSIYGTSKAAVRYLTEAMAAETKESKVLIGSLSPGMVMTDLVLERFKDDPQALEKNKRIFNIIGDRVENVAPWLVERILSNEKHGVRINYLSRAKMFGRFLAAPFSKRDLFSE